MQLKEITDDVDSQNNDFRSDKENGYNENYGKSLVYILLWI